MANAHGVERGVRVLALAYLTLPNLQKHIQTHHFPLPRRTPAIHICVVLPPCPTSATLPPPTRTHLLPS